MILGEIIINEKLSQNSLIKKIREKSFLNIKEVNEINPNIPTQIIGWNKVKELFDKNISILNKTIEKNLYWTFSPDEKCQDFNEDIITFINYLYGDFVEDIKYQFIDPIILKIKTWDDFKNKYNIENLDNAYFIDDFIYLFKKEKNIVYGFDLKYNKVLNINNDELIENIKNDCEKISYESYELETSLYQKYKNLFDKEIDKKYIVVFENEL